MNRVFRVAVSKIVLDQPQIVAFIRQVKPARMPQHVGMKRTEAGTPGRGTDEVVDGLPGHRLPALRYKQPRQGVVTCMQVTLVSAAVVKVPKTAFQDVLSSEGEYQKSRGQSGSARASEHD